MRATNFRNTPRRDRRPTANWVLFAAVGIMLLFANVSLAEKIALVGGTLHTVSGDDIENGVLIVEGETIAAVGRGMRVPTDARLLDVTGLHVYPAMMNPNSVLGLVEVSSVPGTVDVAEMGDINPNVRPEIGVNPDSEILPVTMANGILTAMIAPRGGLIAGTAAIIRLKGWTWEDMTIASPVGLLINWPNMRIDSRPRARPREKQIEARDEQMRLLRQAFADARAYMQARDAEGEPGVPRHERDPRWEAMLPVLRGEIPVLVSAEDLHQIRAALRWAEEEGLRMTLIAGGDVWRVAGELAARNIPVILTPVHDLPQRRWEPYDTPFTIANKLHQAGVRFCFGYSASSFGAAHSRNLPYQAATAAAYGLPKKEALRGVTQYPAEILGVGDRLGTLEVGKEATFIVTDGDPLEIRTEVLQAFMAGEEIDLDNRHHRLYEKYRARPWPEADVPKDVPAITRRK